MTAITIDHIASTACNLADEAMQLMTHRAEAARNTEQWREAFDRYQNREWSEAIEHNAIGTDAAVVYIRACRAADRELEIEWPDNSHRQPFERRALGALIPSGRRCEDVLDVLELGYDPVPVERRINAEMATLPEVRAADILD